MGAAVFLGLVLIVVAAIGVAAYSASLALARVGKRLLMPPARPHAR